MSQALIYMGDNVEKNEIVVVHGRICEHVDGVVECGHVVALHDPRTIFQEMAAYIIQYTCC